VSEGADGFVTFLAAGEPAVGEFRCSECRYGVTIARALPVCPMCGGTIWERARWALNLRPSLTAVTAHAEQPVA
jgi:hypothetical protein